MSSGISVNDHYSRISFGMGFRLIPSISGMNSCYMWARISCPPSISHASSWRGGVTMNDVYVHVNWTKQFKDYFHENEISLDRFLNLAILDSNISFLTNSTWAGILHWPNRETSPEDSVKEVSTVRIIHTNSWIDHSDFIKGVSSHSHTLLSGWVCMSVLVKANMTSWLGQLSQAAVPSGWNYDNSCLYHKA